MFSHHTVKVTMIFVIAVVLVNLANFIYTYNAGTKALWGNGRPIAAEMSDLGMSLKSTDQEQREIKSKMLNGRMENENWCPEIPPGLGPVRVIKTEIELVDVENKFPEVNWGGRYSPPNCTARDRVAIIVPYRDRQQHLAIFLNHMHPFLMKQQIEYGIFIVEQEGNKEFNRAKLMNVGFMEAQRLKTGGWHCFIFHDVDLLPMDSRNLYTCPRQPRHMSTSIDKYNFRLPYNDIFGGVSALTLEQFTRVNGFSNKYWGWGGEDDDMFHRLKKRGYHVARYKMSIARYTMLGHKNSSPNPKRLQLLSQTSQAFQKDGLSTLEYQLAQMVQFHLYTHILVNIDERGISSARRCCISPNSCLATIGSVHLLTTRDLYPYYEFVTFLT